MRHALPILLILTAGCSGGPLKEIPVFEPPPPEPEESAPPPAEEPPDAVLPTLQGTWSSTAALGPGSASIRRIVMVFDPEGGFTAAAFGTSKISSLTGTYRSMDGAVEVDLGADGLRLWAAELDVDTLLLREQEREIRLTRLR